MSSRRGFRLRFGAAGERGRGFSAETGRERASPPVGESG
jgi:hypothetical protein